LNPSRIGQAWQASLLTRLTLFLPVGVGLFFLGASPAQRLLLVLWCLGLVLFQSFDVLIVYRRDFLLAALVETLTLSGLALCLLGLGQTITVDWLILLYGLIHLLKAGIYGLRYREALWNASPDSPALRDQFDLQFFAAAFPFFLLGFSGMLQSRIDLYAVNIFLTERDVGQYQIFINLMIYLQSVSAFILIPFVKTLYRLGQGTIQKIAIRLFAFGLVILIPALIGVQLLLIHVYDFQLSPYFMLWGGLFVLPIYFYLPIIYALYKADRQMGVLKINIVGTVLNFALNILLLPRIGMIGAVVASAIAQWVMLAAYLGQNKGLRGSYAAVVPELS
jgi:O-antigen/teichoic acid export membrane protein